MTSPPPSATVPWRERGERKRFCPARDVAPTRPAMLLCWRGRHCRPRIMHGLTLATPDAPSGIAAASPAPAAAERAYALWTLAAVAAITAARLAWLAVSQTDLYPDEAQ